MVKHSYDLKAPILFPHAAKRQLILKEPHTLWLLDSEFCVDAQLDVLRVCQYV